MYVLRSLLLLTVCAMSGCSTSEILIPHAIELTAAPEDVAEEQLLDIGITVFDPGVPDGEIDKETLEKLLEEGAFVHVRRAEAVYMAVQLRNTLQKSGQWGMVWVTLPESRAADVDVSAKILQSDGHIVRVDVHAVDAAGRTWIDKLYELEAVAGAYDRRRYPDLDPYQDLFNLIANDLVSARAELSAAEVRAIRTVGAVRYAHALAPVRYEGYVDTRRSGSYKLLHLPAADDPIFERTLRVRQRERLLFETLNQHYDAFAREVEPTYSSWRASAREEAAAARQLTRTARWHKALGVTATVASIASFLGGGLDPSSFSGRFVRESMMLMGANMLQMSAMHTQGRRLHESALKELSASFDDEAESRFVEIADVQRRLIRTAEMQFAEWRELLQRIFSADARPAFDGDAPWELPTSSSGTASNPSAR